MIANSSNSDTIRTTIDNNTRNLTTNLRIQPQQRQKQRPYFLRLRNFRSLANHHHQQSHSQTASLLLLVLLFVAPINMLLFSSSFTISLPRITTTMAFRSVVVTIVPRHQYSSAIRKNPHHHHQNNNLWYNGRHRVAPGTTTITSSSSPLWSPLFSTSPEDTSTATASVLSTSSDSSPEATIAETRLSAQGLSLDLKTIINHYDVVVSHITSRNPSNTAALQAIQSIAETAQQRTTLIQERDAALNERRTYSDRMGALLRQQKEFCAKHQLAPDVDATTIDDATLKEEYQQMIEELEKIRTESLRVAALADESDEQLQILQTEMDDQLSILPNLLDDQVPTGRDEADNEIVYTHGDIYTLPQRLGWPAKYCGTDSSADADNNDPNDDSWKPAWHDDIATRVDGYLSDAAVQMSGSRFIALRAEIAQLERAIGQWMIDLHTSPEHNYIEVSVPYVVSRSTLVGTGQLPKFEEDLFAITPSSHTCNGEDAFLIPTAEVPITNLHRNEVLNEEDLPISYVALTPCFRAEAGSYGRDTKGLIRTHQFHKVELVKITSASNSQEQHELLTTHAEKCLQLLELPYRKVRLCSGDIGFSANHCYDLEVYLPGSQEYREISSCSNTGDFQARRLALRYRPKPVENTDPTKAKKKGGANTKLKPVLCHTINGSGLAVGRTLVAILENYQRPDGSIVIPDVLRPYMKGKDVIMKQKEAA